MTLKSNLFALVLRLSGLVAPMFLLFEEEVDADLPKVATSQNDFVVNEGASVSGWITVEVSVGASMDINSMQCSFNT